MRRLFPTAYPDDPEKEAEYQRFMRDELVASRTAALDAVEATLDATRARRGAGRGVDDVGQQPPPGARARCSTSARSSTIDALPDDDPDIQTYALYAYLSLLLERRRRPWPR